MKFLELKLAGAYKVVSDQFQDNRGKFFRTFCRREFQENGLSDSFEQESISTNFEKATLRGLHYQKDSQSEIKLVRCIRGSIFDVIVDMRVGSNTRGQWLGFELNENDGTALYIPRGFAHGFQTLTDHSELLYLITPEYSPEAVAGIRWNDPHLQISWPHTNPILSERDKNLPDFPL